MKIQSIIFELNKISYTNINKYCKKNDFIPLQRNYIDRYMVCVINPKENKPIIVKKIRSGIRHVLFK